MLPHGCTRRARGSVGVLSPCRPNAEEKNDTNPEDLNVLTIQNRLQRKPPPILPKRLLRAPRAPARALCTRIPCVIFSLVGEVQNLLLSPADITGLAATSSDDQPCCGHIAVCPSIAEYTALARSRETPQQTQASANFKGAEGEGGTNAASSTRA